MLKKHSRLRGEPDRRARYSNLGYLVLGEVIRGQWSAVRRVRAWSDPRAVGHGRREDVVLDEVDPSMRAPILRRYVEVASGGRAHFPIDQGAPLEQFEQISEQYPVFRIRVDSAR